MDHGGRRTRGGRGQGRARGCASSASATAKSRGLGPRGIGRLARDASPCPTAPAPEAGAKENRSAGVHAGSVPQLVRHTSVVHGVDGNVLAYQKIWERERHHRAMEQAATETSAVITTIERLSRTLQHPTDNYREQDNAGNSSQDAQPFMEHADFPKRQRTGPPHEAPRSPAGFGARQSSAAFETTSETSEACR